MNSSADPFKRLNLLTDSHIDKTEILLQDILTKEITGLDGTEKMLLSVTKQNAVMSLDREHTVTGTGGNPAKVIMKREMKNE